MYPNFSSSLLDCDGFVPNGTLRDLCKLPSLTFLRLNIAYLSTWDSDSPIVLFRRFFWFSVSFSFVLFSSLPVFLLAPKPHVYALHGFCLPPPSFRHSLHHLAMNTTLKPSQ